MKKPSLLALLIITFFTSYAQLNENFNTDCASSSTGYPSGWSEYNSTTNTALDWNCTPTGGRDGTPGIQCTGVTGGKSYVDTSWLFTPLLDLSSSCGAGPVYLRFDSKYEILFDHFLIVATDTIGYVDSSAYTDLTDSTAPVFTNPLDSANWITYQLNLSAYKSYHLYIAFRYTSSDTLAGIWSLDNVLITCTGLGVTNISEQVLPLTIVGTPESSQISLSYSIQQPGLYDVSVYDMLGREVRKQSINAEIGKSTYTIDHLALHSGMYFIRMGNGSVYGATKVVIP